MLTSSISYRPDTKKIVVGNQPEIWYKGTILLRITIVDADGEGIAQPSTATAWRAVVNNVYGGESDPFCVTLDADINKAGDWDDDGGTADPDEGQLSIRLDGCNADFGTRIGTAKGLAGYLEIRGLKSEACSAVEYRIPISIYNLMDDDETVPPSIFDSYATRWHTCDDGKKRLAYLFDDAAWRVSMHVVIDGQPTHYWEEVTI